MPWVQKTFDTIDYNDLVGDVCKEAQDKGRCQAFVELNEYCKGGLTKQVDKFNNLRVPKLSECEEIKNANYKEDCYAASTGGMEKVAIFMDIGITTAYCRDAFAGSLNIR